jgi:curved DNA-binding protein CbpA
MGSHYDTLGLGRQASTTEIRQAYRRLAKARHPDTGAGSAAAMRRLNDAYATLKDPERRRDYDRQGPRPVSPPPAPPSPLDPQAFRTQVCHPLGRDVQAAIRDIREALGDLADVPDDEEMITAFDLAVAAASHALTKALSRLASVTWPPALAEPLATYRDGLHQAEAAVDILGSYSLDLDPEALADGEALLSQAVGQLDDSRRALA